MQQLDLLPREVLPIQPAGDRQEPRLWVKKLTMWRKPGDPIREIRLKPGLNIVWSPDASVGSGVIGHGGGKTLFCRLLRYCLGEEVFAPDGQRSRIWDTLPEGFLSADVRLDGADWLIVRSLSPRRRDFALAGGAIEETLAEGARPTGLAPFVEALAAAFIGETANLMPARVSGASAWTVALAWLSRDQECRFDKLLHWRDPASDSRSPVAPTSEGERLEIVRAFVKALTPAEQEVRRNEEAITQNLTNRRTELGHREWELRTVGARLSQALQMPTAPTATELEAQVLETAAKERLTKALGAPGGSSVTDLVSSRTRRNEALEALRAAERSLAVAGARHETLGRLLAQQEGELGPLSAQIVRGEVPFCPVCKIPVDRVLAEGCSITLDSCDLPALKAEFERKGTEVATTKAEHTGLGSQIQSLQADVALARQRFDPLDKTLSGLESASADRLRRIRAAERVVDDAQRFLESVAGRVKLLTVIEAAEAELGRTRETLAGHRSQAGDVINQISRRFDETLWALVPGDISGSVKLDGNGLNLRVAMGGDRTSAAIESLKIVAFDLAVLVRSIEGETSLPAFLIHDSPREADLGRSIYDLLFEFAAKLEQVGSAPQFQYIVTTTTAPPEALKSDPWVRLQLQGAPPEQRLLRVDL